jgi:hypothetical protein
MHDRGCLGRRHAKPVRRCHWRALPDRCQRFTNRARQVRLCYPRAIVIGRAACSERAARSCVSLVSTMGLEQVLANAAGSWPCHNRIMKNRSLPRAGSAGGSILSIGSSGSILSIGSTGSILSIGSAGSFASIGSFASLGSFASAWSIGSLFSFASVTSGFSAAARNGWGDPKTVLRLRVKGARRPVEAA